MNEFSDPKEAASWLKSGKILIHPTEGVWGLGCDAFNLKACQKINSLKKILFISGTRADFGKIKPLIEKVKSSV